MAAIQSRSSREAQPLRGARRRMQLAAALALCLVSWLALPTAAGATPPNIVFVVASDLGVDQVGAYGEATSPPATPHIDALAASGRLFRNAWANAAGTATRASLLTGRHALGPGGLGHTGLGSGPGDLVPGHGIGQDLTDPDSQPGLDPTAANLASTLEAQGYNTAAFGRWDLAGCTHTDGLCTGPAPAPEEHPLHSGFDYYAGALGGAGPDFCSWNRTTSEWSGSVITSSTAPVADYAPHVTAQDAAAYLGTLAEPFFVWVALDAAEGPLHQPPLDPIACTTTTAGTDLDMARAMVESVDDAVGTVLAGIPAPVRANTLVVFVSDGGSRAEATQAPFDPTHTGDSLYEAGINVPLIVEGAGVALPGESAAPVHVVDLLATVAALADPPVDVSADAPDSVDTGAVLADAAAPSPRSLVFSEGFAFDGSTWDQAVRDDRYKLHYRQGGSSLPGAAFYDLQSDPHEQTDLLASGTPLSPEQETARSTLHLALSDLAGVCFVPDDGDMDCVEAPYDNCTGVANGRDTSDQCDSDADGYGNACDADLDNDPGTSDLTRFLLAYPSVAADPHYDADADMDCDGDVDADDLALFLANEGVGAPGPSGLGCAGSASCEAAQRDNFLIVILDDVGVDKVGVYRDGECSDTLCPNPPPTPVIDSLAAEGVLFRNATSNAVCSPTRATVLTGRHSLRTGVGNFIRLHNNVLGLDPDTPSIASVLKSEGYSTAAFGKWHMAGCIEEDGACTGETYPHGAHPIWMGFDYFSGNKGNFNTSESTGYCEWEHVISQRTGPGQDDYAIETFASTNYTTWQTATDTIGYVKQMPEPWLAWVAFNAAHTPLHYPPTSPIDCTTTSEKTENVEMYDEMMTYMDTEIGRMLVEMDQNSDVLDRTTILVFGDNGTVPTAAVLPFESAKAKGSIFEGGTNVPFIATGPHIAPVAAGVETAGLINTTDVFATLMDIAGVSSCAGSPGCAEDSVSFFPYFSDPGQPSVRDFVYAERFWPNGTATYPDILYHSVRGARYKLSRINTQVGTSLRLYDLQEDPFEDDNLLREIESLTPEETAAMDDLGAEMNRLSGTCPGLDDLDGDCVLDVQDNCLGIVNGPLEHRALCGGDQLDSDSDGAGDACDGDWAEATFNLEFAFECQMSWPVGVFDFDSLSPGQNLSDETLLADSPYIIPVTFPSPVPDLIGSGPDLALVVVEDLGDNPAISGLHTLGVDDAANFHGIAAGADLQFSFPDPMVAFGFTVVTPGPLADDDLELSLSPSQRVGVDSSEGTYLGQINGTDYYSYFLGIGSTAEFSNASLEAGPSVPVGDFFFNVDDLLAVPEPPRWASLAVGLVVARLLARRRSNRAGES